MEDEEIPFRTYSAVSFAHGSARSFSFFSVCAAMWSPTVRNDEILDRNGQPRAWIRSAQARMVLLLVALVTSLVCIAPTLLSAATGYRSESFPVPTYYNSFELAQSVEKNATSITYGEATWDTGIAACTGSDA
jgi:hypothetical protein